MNALRVRARTRHRRGKWATQGLWLGGNAGIAGYLLYWLQVLDLEFLTIKREMSFSVMGDLVFRLTPLSFKLLYGFCLLGGTLTSAVVGTIVGYLLGKGLSRVWREAHQWRAIRHHERHWLALAREEDSGELEELDLSLLPLPQVVRPLARLLPPDAAQDYVDALLDLYVATYELQGERAARRRLFGQLLLSAPSLLAAEFLRRLVCIRKK